MSSAQGRLRGHRTNRQAQLVQGWESEHPHLLSLPPGPSLQGETLPLALSPYRAAPSSLQLFWEGLPHCPPQAQAVSQRGPPHLSPCAGSRICSSAALLEKGSSAVGLPTSAQSHEFAQSPFPLAPLCPHRTLQETPPEPQAGPSPRQG